MDYIRKALELGRDAIALIELHLEKPEDFNAETILDLLLEKSRELEKKEEV